VGTLYLVATPIGNLEDITLRALRILKQVALIAAEDTRRTRHLCAHYGIATPLESYHAHSGPGKVEALLRRLLQGQDVAVVSDAGTPGISDPGEELVRLAVAAGVPVVPIPGPNAALAALTASGLPAAAFRFLGFLLARPGPRAAALQRLAEAQETLVLYEAPHRLRKTLAAMIAAWGPDRPLVVGRELTKKFEEFVRGTLAEVAAHFETHEPRGEFCLVEIGRAHV
jgi:16S rRNA (cytidine1402-2'-O)-methyltransferase